MSFITWNVKVVNDPIKIDPMRSIIKKHKPEIVTLLGSNTSFNFIASNSSETGSGGLVFIWNLDVF